MEEGGSFSPVGGDSSGVALVFCQGGGMLVISA